MDKPINITKIRSSYKYVYILETWKQLHLYLIDIIGSKTSVRLTVAYSILSEHCLSDFRTVKLLFVLNIKQRWTVKR